MLAASVRATAAAVTFLTRVPVGRALVVDADDVGRSAVVFPLVGAGVGALGGLTADSLAGPLPALLAGALGLALAVALTGALHVDALADTADALVTRDRARALAIMRDSRTGSFGAVAIALAVLVEAIALGSLAEHDDALPAFVVAGALSRAASPALARWLPYARSEPGPGSVLSGRVSIAGAAVGATAAGGLGAALLGWDGVIAIGVAALTALVAGLGSRAWLGGVTGDTLGAATQLAEIAVLVVLVGLR
jgi:adenosylcobinamide-GDP ribazoletransferase